MGPNKHAVDVDAELVFRVHTKSPLPKLIRCRRYDQHILLTSSPSIAYVKLIKMFAYDQFPEDVRPNLAPSVRSERR